ncbi:MAG: hypothetical protein V7637_12 [Mycobacteriales bacterium]
MSPPYAAELRVYEPLSAFPGPERKRWEAYAASGSAVSARDGQRRERQLGLLVACRARARVPRPGEFGEYAYLLSSHSGLVVCPWRTEPRSWAAAAELGTVLSPELAELALPADEAELAGAEHERWLAGHPEARAHVLSSRWVVPVRWFLPFHRDERRLQLGATARHSPGVAEPAAEPVVAAVTAVDRSLVYRTEMAQARRRIARALAVLRRAFDAGPVVGAVESLGRWLEEFHPRSIVELDYGGIVDLRSDAELRADDSVGDVAEALGAVADGDADNAARAYDRVIERWRIAHRVESAN